MTLLWCPSFDGRLDCSTVLNVLNVPFSCSLFSGGRCSFSSQIGSPYVRSSQCGPFSLHVSCATFEPLASDTSQNERACQSTIHSITNTLPSIVADNKRSYLRIICSPLLTTDSVTEFQRRPHGETRAQAHAIRLWSEVVP